MDFANFSDEDFRASILRMLRVLAVLTAAATPLVWMRSGWPSVVYLLLGAVFVGSGVWEWLRLLTVAMSRMDAGATPRPVGAVVAGFILRLVLAGVALYASLKYLHGSVYALVLGIGLGLAALLFEAIRLLKTWTV